MRAVGRAVIVTVALAAFAGPVAGVTTYDIAVDGDTAAMNVTMELYAQQTDRTTRLTFDNQFLPEGTTVTAVRDSDGPLNYTVDGRRIRFETEITPQEGKEVVHIRATVDGLVETEHRDLDLVTLQLSGFPDRRDDVPDEVTQVRLTTDRPLLSGSHSFGFDAALGMRGANYSGEGPVNLQLAISDGGEWYDNYVLFGPGNLSTADQLYDVAVAVTGFVPQVNRWPVVVYPDETYDERVDAWSAGQYRTGGLIFIRNSTLQEAKGPSIVLHEVMHGFNADALRWTSANRAWFDEGTASYVEWLVNAKRDVRQAAIFGDEVTWTEGRTRYTLPPEGTPEDLLDYYRENWSFMEDWRLMAEPEHRTFGYAYSELLIRRYVLDNGPSALRPVYSEMRRMDEELEDEVQGTRASNRRILDVMGTQFRPCYTTDRAELEACLDEVHRMEAVVPSLDGVANRSGAVTITPIDDPQDPEPVAGGNGSVIRDRIDRGGDASAAFLQQLVAAIMQFLRSLQS